MRPKGVGKPQKLQKRHLKGQRFKDNGDTRGSQQEALCPRSINAYDHLGGGIKNQHRGHLTLKCDYPQQGGTMGQPRREIPHM